MLVQSFLRTVMESALKLVTSTMPPANYGSRRLTLVEQPNSKAMKRDGLPAAQTFSAAEMRHHFAIWKLTNDTAANENLQLYFCTRCKWAFSVDGRRALVTPLDGSGNQLAGAAARERLATFAWGPCPIFSRLTQNSRLTQQVTLMDNLGTRLLALIFAGYQHMLASFGRNVHRSSV